MRTIVSMILCCIAVAGALPASAQNGTFGLSHSGGRFVVDSGANLVFGVDDSNGDLVSMRYRGTELQSTEAKGSQIASGLGPATVTARTVGNTIVISAQAGDLIHYYIAHKGRDAIYMATYAPTLLPIGELRFVTRLNVSILPNADHEPDSNVGTAIEAKDVFLLPDGRTSSKFYSARRAIDDNIHGVSGTKVAVRMWMGNREYSSGGPFFKDIATQKTVITHELYNYMFSNHTQTEAYRGGLHGVYALLFTDGGAAPATATDLSFVDATLQLKGFLDSTGRGAVSGQVSGVANGQAAVVGLSNDQAQYWASTDSTGQFQIADVVPGHYRITLYQNELEVAHDTLEVDAGSTAQTVLRAVPLQGQVQWQIGVPDGTPSGFRNASLLPTMHPSDQSMAPWGPLTYRVGTSALEDFPAVQWHGVNAPTRIEFVLGADQVRAYRLRIFVPLTQAGARPQVSVNSQWTGPLPPRPDQPDSRGITRGTYRGNNTLYLVDIPATALQAGLNWLDIDAVSGSPDNDFLGPAVIFDSVQLIVP